MKPYPTQDYLKQILHYDPTFGILTWKIRPAQSVKIGDQIGCMDRDRYIFLSIKNKTYYAHRLAWIISYGEIPENKIIYHLNGNKSDNRLENLTLERPFKNRKKRVRKPKEIEVIDAIEEIEEEKQPLSISDIVETYRDNNQFNITPLFLMRNHPITRATAGVICSKLQTLNP
jgi:hypothetical protein